jgi:hypothetical protein
MIIFFRKIRQKLLSENKLGKYLTYAIGEIVLVMIGILLALQVNNWNENRKDAIQEKIVLKSLFENLTLANNQSELLIFEEVNLKKGLIQILGIESGEDIDVLEYIPDSIFKSAVWDLQSDQPTFNTYNNLKNTNKLGLIKNKKLNEKFTDLEFRLNKLNDILEDRLSVHQIRIDDISEKGINFIPLVKSNVPEVNIENEVKNDYFELLKSKSIRNLLGMKLTFTQDVIDRREDLDKEIKELIVLIKNEIEQ